MTAKLGDLVECVFLDHCEDGDALHFVAYGRVTGISKDASRQPGEFTIKELAEGANVGRFVIERRLKKEKWKFREIVEHGHRQKVWSKP